MTKHDTSPSEGGQASAITDGRLGAAAKAVLMERFSDVHGDGLFLTEREARDIAGEIVLRAIACFQNPDSQ